MEWLLFIVVVVLLRKVQVMRKQAVSAHAEVMRALDERGHTAHSIENLVMAVYGGYAYWLDDDGTLVRAPWTGAFADLDDLEPVDPLTFEDLNPADVIAIIDAIEEAAVRHAAGEDLDRLG